MTRRAWRRLLAALLPLAFACGCASSAQIKACNAKALEVDAPYLQELASRCYGYELDVCPFREEIELKYAAKYDAAESSCSKS